MTTPLTNELSRKAFFCSKLTGLTWQIFSVTDPLHAASLRSVSFESTTQSLATDRRSRNKFANFAPTVQVMAMLDELCVGWAGRVECAQQRLA